MYKINVPGDVTIAISGSIVNPAQHPITLNPGNNWIGFPVSQSMSISEAFAPANPVDGDRVSRLGQYAEYYNGIWYGGLQTLEPGQGYIYKSKATSTKTFTYPTR